MRLQIHNSYPEASGGKRTTTLPISACGSSTNLPSCALLPILLLALSVDCREVAWDKAASASLGRAVKVFETAGRDLSRLNQRKTLAGTSFFDIASCQCFDTKKLILNW